ncbi:MULTISPECIES: hemerythrin domain-containing protein [Longispora]|uniref:Hemerythrin-like domain-containing protein n=1 Tax=Longispora fulva TaxID=619741 RepID=A0A8J7GCE5_9ACTN|nr:hemerythrin domain-containing protein [Longispora fulva]MBG6133882.1 hypothetical protein [Longispora fulva]
MTDHRPDTHDMILVHRVYRREFALAPSLIRDVEPGDHRRAAELAVHIDTLLVGLHRHHRTEDELLWPKLRERVRIDGLLVDRMTDQHVRVAQLIDGLGVPLAAWRISPEVVRRERLARLLTELALELTAHLDDEEQLILPLAAEHLSVEEWDQLGKHGMAGLPQDRLLMALGAILEDADQDERAAFLAKLPVPVQLVWRQIGAIGYERTMARIRAAA